MARVPEQHRPVIRLVIVAFAIGLMVVAVIAALVWRPVVSSLHLYPAPVAVRAAHALDSVPTSLSAGSARAP